MSAAFADRVRQLGRTSRAFPNIGLAGVYDALSQTVTVLTASEEDRARWRASSNPLYESREFIATAVHELTHWLDGTSTLWGQTLLVDIHNAMTAWSSGEEDDLWRILDLHNRLNRGGRARYYSIVDQPDAIGDSRSWKINFSSGLEYGVNGRLDQHRPLVFVSFSDIHDKRICRVPLTEMALLEVNAMGAELTTRRQLMASVSEDSRVVEGAEMNREMMKFFYTPSLAIYSAAAHLVANYHRMTDLDAALEVAGRLATLTLNVPARLVQDLNVPDELHDRWGPRVDALRQLADPGFLFFVLCQTAPRYEAGVSVAEWVDATLEGAGLPGAANLATVTAGDLLELPAQLLPGTLFRTRGAAILTIGRENFARRGLVAEEPLSLNALANDAGPLLPEVVLLDESLAPLTPKPITDPLLHPLPSLDVASRYAAWSSTFVDAIRF